MSYCWSAQRYSRIMDGLVTDEPLPTARNETIGLHTGAKITHGLGLLPTSLLRTQRRNSTGVLTTREGQVHLLFERSLPLEMPLG